MLERWSALTIFSGKQHLTLTWRDLQAYEGSRATRGNALPRGYTRVDSVVTDQGVK